MLNLGDDRVVVNVQVALQIVCKGWFCVLCGHVEFMQNKLLVLRSPHQRGFAEWSFPQFFDFLKL